MRMGPGLLLCGLLAACGGGTGGGGGGGVTPAPVEPVITDPRTLPTTGRATFDGYMQADLPTGADGAREAYLADLRMDVNFAAGFDQIRGTATGFRAAQDRRLGGQLAIAGGEIYRDTDTSAAYTFDGDLSGTLTDGADRYAIDGAIEGEFLGAERTGVRGLVFGDIKGPEGVDIFDGTFAGERVQD